VASRFGPTTAFLVAGGAAAGAIVQARKLHGPFRGIFDFCERLDPGEELALPATEGGLAERERELEAEAGQRRDPREGQLVEAGRLGAVGRAPSAGCG